MWEQVKCEENHALNFLLMENSDQTLFDIKEGLDFTQALYNTTVWASDLVSNTICPRVQAICAKGMPWSYKWKLLHGTSLSHQETKHMEYSARTTFADLQTKEAKKSSQTLSRKDKTAAVSNI